MLRLMLLSIPKDAIGWPSLEEWVARRLNNSIEIKPREELCRGVHCMCEEH